MTDDIFTAPEAVEFSQLSANLRGPVLVTGTSGFIGSALGSTLLHLRDDVTLVAGRNKSWRAEAFGLDGMISLDLSESRSVEHLLDHVRPRTIFNLAASGAYSTQVDLGAMCRINIELVSALGTWATRNGSVVIHAGTSSEYGRNSDRPLEDATPLPNSAYGVSKYAGTNLLSQLGTEEGLIGAVLRLYSVYGPGEDPLRLFPTLIRCGKQGVLPPFSSSNVSRDFVYITDVLYAFARAALFAQESRAFDVFNIGSGSSTSMTHIASLAQREFSILAKPEFKENLRRWDLEDWCSNPQKAEQVLRWKSVVDLESGLSRMRSWYEPVSRGQFLQPEYSVQVERNEMRHRVSAIIACYKDELAIPVMYERLKRVFSDLNVDYEIIFVNDGSPDDSTSRIVEISSLDSRVVGIVHSRNFGSQAAFLSGLRSSTGDSCVLMDGDLQDPPEVIAEMLPLLKQGYDIVYGKRVSREATRFMNVMYRLFYRILRSMSTFTVPVDAGDFSLMSRGVVDDLLAFPERDIFLRTNRAYIGRKQIGVPYHRPERMFGRSTNNLLKNVQWAIKGVVSASRKPLSMMSALGVGLVALTTIGLAGQFVLAVFFPEKSPPGLVTVILLVGFFGAINLLGISVIGEYVGRILDEVRGRPRYIQSQVIKNGEVRSDVFRDDAT